MPEVVLRPLPVEATTLLLCQPLATASSCWGACWGNTALPNSQESCCRAETLRSAIRCIHDLGSYCLGWPKRLLHVKANMKADARAQTKMRTFHQFWRIWPRPRQRAASTWRR